MLKVSFISLQKFANDYFISLDKKVKKDKRVKLEKKKDYIYLMLALNIAMIMWKGKEMMVKNQIYCFHGEENATISMYKTVHRRLFVYSSFSIYQIHFKKSYNKVHRENLFNILPSEDYFNLNEICQILVTLFVKGFFFANHKMKEIEIEYMQYYCKFMHICK